MTVEVREGQVTLGGSVGAKGLIPIIVRLCRGVVSVSEHISYRTDNTQKST